MSTAEGPRKFELEKKSLDLAYQEQIGEHFKAYYFAVANDQVTPATRQAALAKFKAAANALYRAHVHATSVYSDRDF